MCQDEDECVETVTEIMEELFREKTEMKERLHAMQERIGEEENVVAKGSEKGQGGISVQRHLTAISAQMVASLQGVLEDLSGELAFAASSPLGRRPPLGGRSPLGGRCRDESQVSREVSEGERTTFPPVSPLAASESLASLGSLLGPSAWSAPIDDVSSATTRCREGPGATAISQAIRTLSGMQAELFAMSIARMADGSELSPPHAPTARLPNEDQPSEADQIEAGACANSSGGTFELECYA
ncbi:hypothetical protein T484DRAFT_1899668 [Baffinella frigidus]|nr:hypothetical protein T484DRAFT_1899668 [Cryptophyta sp. CCMP2293]